MPRYTPYGLTEDDNVEPHTKVTPERVKSLMEIYRRNHIEYPWTEEDRNEQIFDYRIGLKSTTYTYVLEAIYRVRDLSLFGQWLWECIFCCV
jgi:hypothetical protein